MFQTSVHLCFMVAATYTIVSASGTGFVFAGVQYVGSISSYFLLAVTLLHIMDMLITPVVFRLTYVAPVALYSMLLCFIAGKFSQLSNTTYDHSTISTKLTKSQTN